MCGVRRLDSLAHLARDTGQTPIGYVHRLRCSEARDLLVESDMTVAEISDYLGFCDPTYFNRVFRKVTGMPPSALTKRASRKND